MKVLKFGGTSVGTVESLRNVKDIVEGLDAPAVVVVSALGGLTDKLIETANKAACGDNGYTRDLEAIRKRHMDIIDSLVERSKDTVANQVNRLLDELGNLFLGVSLIEELPPKTLDRIVSFGERCSSLIVAAIIEGAEHRDSLEFIKTERWMDKDIADRATIETKVKEYFSLPLGHHIVIGGFISKDSKTGAITNLGRGGSDFTAALIAATLNAESLDIWTDVDGFMTSDPRIIPEAKVIPRMTFVESMELCTFGAKVIYPPTIYPVFHKNIPIRILNTHNSSAPGTLITDNACELPDNIRGVSSIRHTDMITVRFRGGAELNEFNSRAYNALARSGVSVLVVTQRDNSNEFSISLIPRDSARAMGALESEFAPEIGNGEIEKIDHLQDKAVLAAVKEGIRSLEGLGARLSNTLYRGGVKVLGMSDGSSDSTIAIIVDDKDAVTALKLVHDSVIPSN